MTNKEQTISNLKKLKSFHNGSYGADINRAIKALEESRWIPITERLPDKTDWYLCTLSGHLAQTIVDMCRFEAVNGGFWSGCIEYNVVAWMELPKPYKEGAEDDTHN